MRERLRNDHFSHLFLTLSLLLLLFTTVICCASSSTTNDDSSIHSGIPECTLYSPSSCQDFRAQCFNLARPCVIRAEAYSMNQDRKSRMKEFAKTKASYEYLSSLNLSIQTSTAETYTGKIFRETTVAEFVSADPEATGAFYFFGNHHGAAWEEFLTEYPPVVSTQENELDMMGCVAVHRSTLAFGAGIDGMGVPFHFHGPGFLQVLNGHKTWFLSRDEPKEYSHNGTVLEWARLNWPKARIEEEKRGNPMDVCTLDALDVVYFPDKWYHATLNGPWSLVTDTCNVEAKPSSKQFNVWMSTFT